jgi:hypothetical protein
VTGAAGLAFALLLFLNLRGTQAMIDRAPNPDYLTGAAEWLAEHTPSGSMVFQTDWDDFTRLFYHNTHNTYLIGLDPTYLQRADPELWNTWTAITQGKVADPSATIEDTFRARYVVSDTRHAAFEQQADTDPNMRRVYRDRYNIIWEITAVTAYQGE